MKLRDVMTRHVEVVRPDSTVKEAAQKMKQIDVGSIPVCEGDRMIGIITDRDIAIRLVAAGRDANTRVSDCMTSEVVCCRADEDIKEAARLMEDKQIRRLAIVDDDLRLVGIVSLGDLATDTGDSKLAGEALEKISEPSQPGNRRAA